MYVPPQYCVDDGWSTAIVRRYPLALLLSNGPDIPYASHVPVITADDAPLVRTLRGSALIGHMNRSNPHWKTLLESSPTPVKLVFNGPNSYITPTIYDVTPAAPTWNFVSVHLQGTLIAMPDASDALTVVQKTVDVFEAAFGDRWCSNSSRSYFCRIIAGVGAFRVEVEHIDTMFKLSQEQAPDVQRKVQARLAGADSGTARELAQIMGEYAD